MLKFKHAVFCYYITGFSSVFHAWFMLMYESLKRDGLLSITDSNREMLAEWATNMFAKKVDFETIIHILSGDQFFEQNKTDVIKLERETGKKITQLWDTDPIFAKYPRLRTFARNKEFEIMWKQMKAKQK